MNCVAWIKKYPVSDGDDVGLVSSSVDTTAVVWRYTEGKLQPIATLKNHTGPVNGVSAICLHTCQNQSVTMTTYVATSSADSTVNIWKQENDGE